MTSLSLNLILPLFLRLSFEILLSFQFFCAILIPSLFFPEFSSILVHSPGTTFRPLAGVLPDKWLRSMERGQSLDDKHTDLFPVNPCHSP